GNDKIVNQIVNIIAPKNDITLGIIPIGEKNKIAELLGIPQAELACSVLSGRKIEKLDIGKIDKQFYFLSGAIIPSKGVKLKFDEGFTITPIDEEGYISIYNFYCPMNNQSICNDPQNGLLEVSVETKPITNPFKKMNAKNQLPSIFPIKKVTVIGKKTAPIIVDCEIVAKTPAVFRVAPQKLKVIVGKERLF
ncbi:MAG: diacylglycerol kinase family protein, partial [bacterium]